MFFAINPANGVPIYEQIVRQTKFAIASRSLASGELIPSIRELARELTLNPNTIARAYRQLQSEGILETVRGAGLQVTPGAARLCVDERLKLVRARLREVLQEAKQSRIDPKQLRAMIERELAALSNAQEIEVETVETVIRIDRLTKRFGRQIALNNVSWTVPRGAIFALLGENGAGKTTALRLLLGLITPNSGHVRVLGLDPAKHGQELRRRVGYLSEQPGLYDWMTVGEIGRFTGAFYGDCPFIANFRRLADELELPWAKQIKALSKGVRAKVALALALAQDPELLVLDEPTSGLDPLVRREILDRMIDLAAAGKTVLLSSHQIAEVERVADTAAILSHGRLVAWASLEEIKRQTQEITLTLAGAAATPPTIQGEILRSRLHGRQWQALVRNCPATEIERLRRDASIASVEIRTPPLEEIVAGYLQANSTKPAHSTNPAQPRTMPQAQPTPQSDPSSPAQHS